MTNANKRCMGCGEIKSLNDFGIRSASKDGYNYHCKACVRAYNNHYYHTHKPQRQASQRKWYEKNKAWYANYAKERRRKYPDLIRAYHRNWRKKNAEKYNAQRVGEYERRKRNAFAKILNRLNGGHREED